MRKRLLLLLAMLFGAAVAVAATPDWTKVATAAPRGSYVIGNPRAKVRLVEYISYTCPHCRHFTEESAAVLKGQMIRSGSTSVEVRNQIHDKLDLAAALLARCVGAAAFPRFHEALYAKQGDWVTQGSEDEARNGARTALYPPEARLRAAADGAGLSDLARAAGMDDAALDRCFTPAAIDTVLKVSAAIDPAITGTPTFEINGKIVRNVGWAELEPILRAAGAR